MFLLSSKPEIRDIFSENNYFLKEIKKKNCKKGEEKNDHKSFEFLQKKNLTPTTKGKLYQLTRSVGSTSFRSYLFEKHEPLILFLTFIYFFSKKKRPFNFRGNSKSTWITIGNKRKVKIIDPWTISDCLGVYKQSYLLIMWIDNPSDNDKLPLDFAIFTWQGYVKSHGHREKR